MIDKANLKLKRQLYCPPAVLIKTVCGACLVDIFAQTRQGIKGFSSGNQRKQIWSPPCLTAGQKWVVTVLMCGNQWVSVYVCMSDFIRLRHRVKPHLHICACDWREVVETILGVCKFFHCCLPLQSNLSDPFTSTFYMAYMMLRALNMQAHMHTQSSHL